MVCQKVKSLFHLELMMWFALVSGTLTNVRQAEPGKCLGLGACPSLLLRLPCGVPSSGPLLEDKRARHHRPCSLPSWDTSHVKENVLDHSAPAEQPRPAKPPKWSKRSWEMKLGCFKPPNSGMVCYPAEADWYIELLTTVASTSPFPWSESLFQWPAPSPSFF